MVNSAPSFQVKTAATILLSGDIPDTVRLAAEKTIEQWRDYYLDHPLVGELHPLFYFLEGLFLLEIEAGDRSYGTRVAEVYTRLMEYQAKDGSLPANIVGHSRLTRSDVLAQALRIGCLLVQTNYLDKGVWIDRLHLLAENLTRHIHLSGAVCFQRPDEEGARHWNVWCTMFTYQAFCYYEELLNDRPLEKLWQELLV